MSLQSLRGMWLRVHRWVALSMGSLLILSGITGAVLVAARPLDEWVHSEYFRAESAAPGAAVSGGSVSLESVRQKMVAEFGDAAAFTFRPPREAGETLQVLIRSTWRGAVYLDPVSGREQGRRGEEDGFVNILYGLHSALLMQERGKAVLAIAALSYLALLISGMVLWWPRRWPPSLRIELRRGLVRSLFDVHRTGGAILGLALAVSIATGAFLAWRPIGVWISAVSGQKAIPAPKQVSSAGPILPLDDLAARARAAFADAEFGYIMVPARTDRPLRVRLRLPDDPHPNGMTSVWVDPRTGSILAKHRWNELDPGTRVNAVIYPLHTGELGGPLLEVVVAFLGAMLGLLGISGPWLWWKRRQAKRRAA